MRVLLFSHGLKSHTWWPQIQRYTISAIICDCKNGGRPTWTQWDKSESCTEANSNICQTKISLWYGDSELVRNRIEEPRLIPEENLETNPASTTEDGEWSCVSTTWHSSNQCQNWNQSTKTVPNGHHWIIHRKQDCWKTTSNERSQFKKLVHRCMQNVYIICQVHMICYATLHQKMSGKNKSKLQCRSTGMRN